jgi:hypothetical protein
MPKKNGWFKVFVLILWVILGLSKKEVIFTPFRNGKYQTIKREPRSRRVEEIFIEIPDTKKYKPLIFFDVARYLLGRRVKYNQFFVLPGFQL